MTSSSSIIITDHHVDAREVFQAFYRYDSSISATYWKMSQDVGLFSPTKRKTASDSRKLST